jgi:hypothetical protein
MSVQLRGILAVATFAATLSGCYTGTREPLSAGERGNGYADGRKSYSSSSTPFLGSAISALEAGEYDQARRIIDRLLAQTPQDASAHYLAGLARLANQDLRGGLKSFEKAVSLDAMLVTAHQQRGVISAQLGRKDEARSTLALLTARAVECKNLCADTADLRAAIVAVSLALDQDAPLPATVVAFPPAGVANGQGIGLPLRDARWLAPGTSITALAREPNACLAAPRDESGALSVNIGRAAFRTPALLGGEARRLGLSCSTCHRNGRSNPDFLFPGVSGKPGTADVTTSVLSSHLGDGIFNPKPIPDLAAPDHKRLISRDPSDAKLEAFIYRAITKEFDGPEPTARAIAGLSTYIRAISARECKSARAVTLATHLDDARVAGSAAAGAWAQGDPHTALLMIASARSALAKIEERYAPGGLFKGRRALQSADLGLAAMQYAFNQGRSDIPVRLIAWRLDMENWMTLLKNDEDQSLYNPAVLEGKKSYR